MDGILILDKPAGISSARAVARVKRLLPKKTKIGHAGTLDPFATGVLLLLIGRATRLCESLMDQAKQYDAVIRFGATTATDDPESTPVAWVSSRANGSSPSTEEINNALAQRKGQIFQIPPTFSALRVNGRRAYDLARKGTPVVMPPRLVTIYDIQPISYAWPNLFLRVDCGRGTYIRSIARDVGAALDVGGYLTELRRTRIGKFDISSAKSLEDLTADSVASNLISMDFVSGGPQGGVASA